MLCLCLPLPAMEYMHTPVRSTVATLSRLPDQKLEATAEAAVDVEAQKKAAEAAAAAEAAKRSAPAAVQKMPDAQPENEDDEEDADMEEGKAKLLQLQAAAAASPANKKDRGGTAERPRHPSQGGPDEETVPREVLTWSTSPMRTSPRGDPKQKGTRLHTRCMS